MNTVWIQVKLHPDQAPVSALASPLSMVGDPPRPSYIQPQPHIPSCWPRRCAASFCPKGALARSDLFSAISWFLFFRFGTLFSDFCPATESPYPPFPEERTLLFGKIILFFSMPFCVLVEPCSCHSRFASSREGFLSSRTGKTQFNKPATLSPNVGPEGC